MQPNPQQPWTPSRAFTLLVAGLAFGGFWWWLARHDDWALAWLGVVVSAFLVLDAARKFAEALKADRIKRALEEETRGPPRRRPTRYPEPCGDQDSWG